MWPDVDQQKVAAAQKRMLYKEELDQQIFSQKNRVGVPATGQPGAEAEDSTSEQAGPSPFSTPAKDVSESHSSTFAVYENKKAITPQDPESKKKAQQIYRAELDQQVLSVLLEDIFHFPFVDCIAVAIVLHF